MDDLLPASAHRPSPSPLARPCAMPPSCDASRLPPSRYLTPSAVSVSVSVRACCGSNRTGFTSLPSSHPVSRRDDAIAPLRPCILANIPVARNPRTHAVLEVLSTFPRRASPRSSRWWCSPASQLAVWSAGPRLCIPCGMTSEVQRTQISLSRCAFTLRRNQRSHSCSSSPEWPKPPSSPSCMPPRRFDPHPPTRLREPSDVHRRPRGLHP